MGPLDGIRVIDLTNMLMGPYATQILGDMGADVIKIEPPGGDPIRGLGPHKSPGMGPMFLTCNRSKRSVVLDLKTDQGLAAMKALLRDADLLVYNRRPQVMERLGLSYDVVRALNPRIIYAGLYGYGQNGPYAAKPAFDDLIQGAVALPSLIAQAQNAKRLHYVPTALVDRGVALWAVGQINAALLHQARTGRGQRLDVPMFEVMASLILGDHMGGQIYDPPIGPAGYPRLMSGDRRPFETADGHVCAMIYTDRHWDAFFAAVPDLTRDSRFDTMTSRTEHVSSIYADLAALFPSRTTADWLDVLDRADIPAMPVHTLDSLIADPHLAATGFFEPVDHPTAGALRDMVHPSHWSETQPRRTAPVPELGQHTAEILADLDLGDAH